MSAVQQAQVVPLSDMILGDRELVNRALESALAGNQGRIGRAAAHLVEAGGKRARPLLSCALARALGVDPGAHPGALISSELVHTASLLHDDLVDGAALRRGMAAAHLRFDPRTAVMAGDLLMSEALRILACDGYVTLVQAAAETVADMARGQVLEAELRQDLTVTGEQLLLVNRLKTASLIAFAARVGARLGQATEQQERQAARFGSLLGEAFQLVDDLLDWTGDPAMTGKPVGQDLREGKVTYPARLALDRDPDLAPVVKRIWAAPGQHPELLDLVRGSMERAGSLEETRALAADLVAQALAALAALPASPWTEHLAAYARGSLNRAA